MARRCPESKLVGLGILQGWKWFIDTRGYANTVRFSEGLVYGLVYEINPTDEASLYRAEGVPRSYTKETMEVELQLTVSKEKSLVQGLVYIDEKRVEEEELWEEYIRGAYIGAGGAAVRGLPGGISTSTCLDISPPEEKRRSRISSLRRLFIPQLQIRNRKSSDVNYSNRHGISLLTSNVFIRNGKEFRPTSFRSDHHVSARTVAEPIHEAGRALYSSKSSCQKSVEPKVNGLSNIVAVGLL